MWTELAHKFWPIEVICKHGYAPSDSQLQSTMQETSCTTELAYGNVVCMNIRTETCVATSCENLMSSYDYASVSSNPDEQNS